MNFTGRFNMKRYAKGWRQTLGRVVRRARRFVAPEMADEYLPSREQLGEAASVEAPWSNAYAMRLATVQCLPSSRHRGVHLSYLPIAKNLRSVGTHLYRNSRHGVQSVIVSGNPEEEEVLAERGTQTWLGVGRAAWKPWLWSRIPRGQLHDIGKDVDDAEVGWQLYFRGLNTPSSDTPRPSTAVPRAPRPKRKTRRILAMARCADYAFRLSPDVQTTIDAAKAEMGWEPDLQTLGIHLRRGDATSDDLTHMSRKGVALDVCMKQADHLCKRYELDTIYLSTESEAEIERARILRPQYRFLYLRHDRGVFPRAGETDLYVETRALQDPSIIEPIVQSALADLYFLQRSDAFIGTFNSQFSVLAWLLCIGHKGYVMPYVNLTPLAGLPTGEGNLQYLDSLPLVFEFARWRRFRQRLKTARQTVHGRPPMEWLSLLRRRWNDRASVPRPARADSRPQASRGDSDPSKP